MESAFFYSQKHPTVYLCGLVRFLFEVTCRPKAWFWAACFMDLFLIHNKILRIFYAASFGFYLKLFATQKRGFGRPVL